MATVTKKCENPNCKKEFKADTRALNRGWGKCCSKSCAAKLREISKPSYNPVTVQKNNFKRLFGGFSKNRHTSEGYRIIGGVAYNEFDEPMYNVNR